MNQKLSNWASIAEIISGVAVVVTLVFLIVELRGNTEEIRAATLTTVAANNQTNILTLLSNPELADIVYRDLQGEDLSPFDNFRVSQYYGLLFRSTEQSFIAFRAGRLEEEIFQTRAQVPIDLIFGTELGQRRWSERRDSGWYVEDFARWLDTELVARHNQ